LNHTDSILPALERRWYEFAKSIKIDGPSSLWEAIGTMQSFAERQYHNIEHVHDCLQKLDAWPQIPEGDVRDSIELAIWFHDIICESTRADNEISSAALLAHFLDDHPLKHEAVGLIMATEHKEARGIRSEGIICDIDLSILGAPAPEYQRYADSIRQEYSWVESTIYAEKRCSVLLKFLNRENIYYTEHARSHWNNQARINLKNEIDSLESL
jgi:predicted metal-dependent HD superfamily phosphohydrolase